MRSKVIFSLLGVLGVLLAAFFYTRGTSVDAGLSIEEQETIQIGMSDPSFDPSAPKTETEYRTGVLAVVLYDKVTFESVENKSEFSILNSGDSVKVLEEGDQRPGFTKVKNKLGKIGWLDASRYIKFPQITEVADFYKSTAPLSALFDSTETMDDDTKRKFEVFLSRDFLNRAKRNSDWLVSNWAKNVDAASTLGDVAPPDEIIESEDAESNSKK